MIDFYDLLGVDNNEISQEIKKAYRKLALKYHPDRHQGNSHEAEEMMKLLNEAKDVLLNDEKREEYDAALYSFQQFKARQQQEAERRQREQAEQAARKKRQQTEQAEREKQEQAKRQHQANAEREKREQAERDRQAQAQQEKQEQSQRQQQESQSKERRREQYRKEQQAQRKREREEAERQARERAWRDKEFEKHKREYEEQLEKERQAKAQRDEQIKESIRKQRLREEEDQRRAKAARLAKEAEEKLKQEAIAHASKKRKRILLVLCVIGFVIAFYVYQKNHTQSDYLDDPYAAYGFDESAEEVQLPPDLYDEPSENELNEQGVRQQERDQHQIHVDDSDKHANTAADVINMTADVATTATTDTAPTVEAQTVPIQPKIEKPQPSATVKKKEDGLSLGNDDFFN